MAITTWNRLEPDIVHDDPLRGVDRSLEARVMDPLWMLARQAQVGEQRGEDGGALVAARATAASYAVTELRVGATTRVLDPGTPLEALVEAEPGALDVTARVAAGELFAALLDERGLAHLAPIARARLAWPVLDGDAGALVRLAAARFADGARLVEAARSGGLADALGATASDRAALDEVAAALLAWAGDRGGAAPADAWIPDRLEHAFALRAHAAEGWVTLAAPEYPGGRLDWDDFVVDGVERTRGGPPARRTVTAQPTVVDVPGMPVVRFWELEDPRFDPGKVSLGAGDLGAALIVEVSLTYASDWYLMPVPLPVGALQRIEELVVTDSFGVAHVIRPAEQVRPGGGWGLWQLHHAQTDQPRLPYLFTPAAMADTVLGELIEEVGLMRDELANVAWAIERIVPDALGRGARVDRRRAPPVAPPPSAADRVYVPLPVLPPDRVPLARRGTPRGAVFRRAAAVDPSMFVGTTTGVLVTDDFAVREEELCRDGLVVTRRWQLCVDERGRRLVWIARAKDPGRGERSARIVFDELR